VQLPDVQRNIQNVQCTDTRTHTHVWLVLESETAAGPTTVEMRCLLIGEDTRRRLAVFSRPKSLESFLNDRRVFAMVVGMHLNVRRTDVHLAAAVLQLYDAN